MIPNLWSIIYDVWRNNLEYKWADWDSSERLRSILCIGPGLLSISLLNVYRRVQGNTRTHAIIFGNIKKRTRTVLQSIFWLSTDFLLTFLFWHYSYQKS